MQLNLRQGPFARDDLVMRQVVPGCDVKLARRNLEAIQICRFTVLLERERHGAVIISSGRRIVDVVAVIVVGMQEPSSTRVVNRD